MYEITHRLRSLPGWQTTSYLVVGSQRVKIKTPKMDGCSPDSSAQEGTNLSFMVPFSPLKAMKVSSL